MALGFPSSSSTTNASPTASSTNTGQGVGNLLPNNSSPTSLYLYTFVATLSLLFVIFGILVARSLRMRRRRNAAILAAIAAGTYVPRAPNGKRHSDPLAPKPVLWEMHIAPGSPAHDPEKGWEGILPVSGATLVPITQQQALPGHLRRGVGAYRLASWSPRRLLRVPYLGTGRGQSTGIPSAPDLPSVTPPTITTSLEPPISSTLAPPPPPPSEPVHLAVLVSMPTRSARGRTESENGGPPVVEFGVAHAAYAQATES